MIASGIGAKTNVRKGRFRIFEMGRHLSSLIEQRGFLFCRNRQHVLRAFRGLLLFNLCGRRFLQNNMCIGAAKAEGADPGQAWFAVALPLFRFGWNCQRHLCYWNMRIDFLKMQVRRNLLVIQRERRFDNAGDARGRFKMADVCFY